MNYINELLFANTIAQTKQLAKDKKQKNKYRQTVLFDIDESEVEELPEEQLNSLASEWEEDERRKGEDRREKQHERGRYIESRQQKNRRYKRELSLKI